MKFNNVAEAFNHYRNFTVEQIEQRTAQIKEDLIFSADLDTDAMKIEVEGLKQAKQNIIERQANTQTEQRGVMNMVTGANFEQRTNEEVLTGNVLETAEYRNAFYKTLLGKELTQGEKAAYDRVMSEQRAGAFNSSSDAVAVIPTQTLNEVVSKARKMGGIMSVARSFNIPAKIVVPVGTPKEAAAWHAEGNAVESEKVDVTGVSFDAHEIIKIFSISAKVKRMSVDAFESYLTDELAACVMATLANGLVNGTGSAQGTGILAAGQITNTVTYSESVTYADVVKTVAALKRGYANGAVWAMNNATLYNQFYGLVDGNKRPIFIADPKAEEIGKILGFPVVVDDNIADGTVIFGNFKYMGYNLPEGIAIEKSTQSSFKNGLIDYRAMAIADCKPIIGEAFVKLVAE